MIFGIKKQRRYSAKLTDEPVGFSCCIEKGANICPGKVRKKLFEKFLDSDTVL